MRKIYFTPGPTELHPIVHEAIAQALKDDICSINHRSKEFVEIYRSTDKALRSLLNIPDDFVILFLGSATECMDRLVQNCVLKSSHHFVNGAFAERFYKTAIELGKDSTATTVEHGKGFDFNDLPDMTYSEMICFTQNETSSGVATDLEKIYEVKEKYPEAIVVIDVVTSVPYIEPDFSKLDAAFFSVQKGFGMPAGLGVLIVNKRCIEKAKHLKEKGGSIGSYHNLLSLAEYAVKYQNTETPNVLAIYLLGKVSQHLLEYGKEKMRLETEAKAELLYSAIDSCANIQALVKKQDERSKTIIIAQAGDKQAEIKQRLLDSGYVVGSGYGKYKDSEIRIANFPMHRLEDVKNIAEVFSSTS